MELNDIEKILSNPFYCIQQVHPVFCEPHETVVTEEMFIGAAERMVEEIGLRNYLSLLLNNLKGDFVEGKMETN